MKMIQQSSTVVDGLFIGVLSGTSMNSIDTVLVKFTANNFIVKNKYSHPFKPKLAKKILNIINSGKCYLSELGQLDQELGLEFAKAINKLLAIAKVDYKQIIAIGSHGQNIWHAPLKPNYCTMQIGDPNIISIKTGIVTVADFRRKDVALGGQGAPLAPGFHIRSFASKIKNRAIINIGGICNITFIPKNYTNNVIGFDLGPGNCLMDEWVQTKFKGYYKNYDQDGKLAAKGKVIPELLRACLNDSYFKKPFPKSTGREYFNLAWLANKISKVTSNPKYINNVNVKQVSNKLIKFNKYDVLNTLLHLTVQSIRQQLLKFNRLFPKHKIEEVYLCGGGAKNLWLLEVLRQSLDCYLGTTLELGVEPEWVEAVLFAWLARQTINCNYGNIAKVTGAKRSAILGGIYLP